MLKKVVIILMSFPVLYAQDIPMSLQLNAGTYLYSGDVGYNTQPNVNYLPAYGLKLEHKLPSGIAFGLSGDMGKISANDRVMPETSAAFARGLNFQSNLINGSLNVAYYTNNGKVFRKTAFLSPFVYAGFGVTKFQVFTDQFYGAANNRYYYWTDGTIRNDVQSNPNAQIVEQDGEYETELTTLGTEGKKYASIIPQVNYGAGFNFRFSPRVSLQLTAHVMQPLSDYLDDVSGKYVNLSNANTAYLANPTGTTQTYRGNENGKNDLVIYPSLGLKIQLGKAKKQQGVVVSGSRVEPRLEPLIPVGPAAQTVAEVKYPVSAQENLFIEPFGEEEKVDGFKPNDEYTLVEREEKIYIRDEKGRLDSMFVIRTDTIWKNKPVVVANAVDDEKYKALEAELEKTKQNLAQLSQKTEKINDILDRQGMTVVKDNAGTTEIITGTLGRVSVYFPLASSTIPATHYNQLKTIAYTLQTNPTLLITLNGYADPQGDEQKNMELSLKRADAVRKYLTGLGVAESRIILQFHGEDAGYLAIPQKRRVDVDYVKP